MSPRFPASVSAWLAPNKPNDYTIYDPAHVTVKAEGPASIVLAVHRDDGSVLEVSMPPLSAERFMFQLCTVLDGMPLEAAK